MPPARQRTLRATLDWSFELLDGEEQRLLPSLAVFSGSSTLEAAEAVCGADLGAVTSLVNKSLLRREGSDDGRPRFRMLETVRDYALVRLQECGEAPQLHRRHAEHFRDVAERSAAELRAGRPSSEVYTRLESDFDNIRAPLRWADSAEPELMLQIAGLLKLFSRYGATSRRGAVGRRTRSLTAALR
jgi:predicted ATPase